MSSSEAKYAVVIAKVEDLQPSLMAKALAAFKGIPLYDAARIAKNCWGIVAEDLEEEPAKKLAAELKTAGLEGAVILNQFVGALPQVQWATHGSREGSIWNFSLKSGGSLSVLPQDIALITAMSYEEVSTKMTETKEGPSLGQKAMSIGFMMATGLPINVGGKGRVVKKTERKAEQLYFANLIVKNPLCCLRLDAKNFNYAYLKERLAYNTFHNFRALIGDLVKSAPGASLNTYAALMAQAKPPALISYESLANGDREIRWLLTLEKIKNRP